MKKNKKPLFKKRKILALLTIFFFAILIPFSPALSLQDFHNHFRGKGINSRLNPDSTEIQQVLKKQPTHKIPLDDFFINLSQNRLHKIFKLKMNLSVDKLQTKYEINKRISQIREMVVILISSKRPEQLSDPREKEILKEEIRETMNSFLTRGQIHRVFLTEITET